jgi:hypothetical protein
VHFALKQDGTLREHGDIEDAPHSHTVWSDRLGLDTRLTKELV